MEKKEKRSKATREIVEYSERYHNKILDKHFYVYHCPECEQRNLLDLLGAAQCTCGKRVIVTGKDLRSHLRTFKIKLQNIEQNYLKAERDYHTYVNETSLVQENKNAMLMHSIAEEDFFKARIELELIYRRQQEYFDLYGDLFIDIMAEIQ